MNYNSIPFFNFRSLSNFYIFYFQLLLIHEGLLYHTKMLENIIGNYNTFFEDLLNRVRKAGIEVPNVPIVNFLYRASTLPEYETLKNKLMPLSKEFCESQFNGRAVSTFVLKEKIKLAD